MGLGILMPGGAPMDVGTMDRGGRRLLFSNGSPFARRIRVLLHEKHLVYAADVLDAVRPIEAIEPHNPALQVPVLHDAGHCLFGTGLITQYLYATYETPPAPPPLSHPLSPPLSPTITRADRHWDDLLILEAIETLSNTIVGLRLLLADGPLDAPYIGRQRHRVTSCLDWLEARIGSEGFWPGTFSVMDLNLLCPMVWGMARGVITAPPDRWPGIATMLDRWASRPSIVATGLDVVEVSTAGLPRS